MENNFCIIIISNGRPNNVLTLKTLKEANCKLPIFILIDDEDKTADEYLKKYTSMVYIFNKLKYAKMVDNYDNSENYRTTTHARNACFDLAKELGYEYFLVLDDDYREFKFRIKNGLIHPKDRFKIKKDIDTVFLLTLEYYKQTNALSVCFSQGGDWFGGETNFNKKPKRKAMNSFFCSVNRRFNFISRLNEDVNTYMDLGKTGNIFLTIPFIQLDQIQTQKTTGGMSEAYLKDGTYTKSFYTVMNRPDCVKVNKMGRTNLRFHHLTDWSVAVPCIISEKYKKL